MLDVSRKHFEFKKGQSNVLDEVHHPVLDAKTGEVVQRCDGYQIILIILDAGSIFSFGKKMDET